MRKRYLSEHGIGYDLVIQKISSWVVVEKDLEFLALVMDQQTACQVVHQDIKLDGRECETLAMEDFRKIK